MKVRTAVLLLAFLWCGCAGDKANKKAEPAAPAAEPSKQTAGQLPQLARATVKGGEELLLDGATVRVLMVTYINQPCPKDVQCVHSGVIRSVRFQVQNADGQDEAVVEAGGEKVVRTVMLRVQDVTEGPSAMVEVQRAVMPKALPLKG